MDYKLRNKNSFTYSIYTNAYLPNGLAAASMLVFA
jgi:hypothetical protein